ncbi:sigma factor [Janibacter sp. GS2]|uniref:sigma factor n=1 Tax=Janibacter sp. GS2 TaxID=3442646 RepID=UPI003EBBCB81
MRRRPAPSHPTWARHRPGCDVGWLLRRVAESDEVAFAALYDATTPRLFGLALRVLTDASRATEVTEDAYLEIWQLAAQFDPRRISATAWMVGIVHRRAVDRLRSDAGTGATHHPDDRLHASPCPETAPHDWARFSPEHREALEMTYFGGYTYTQLAEAIGVSPAAAAARLRHCRPA